MRTRDENENERERETRNENKREWEKGKENERGRAEWGRDERERVVTRETWKKPMWLAVDEGEPATTYLQAGWWEHHQPGHLGHLPSVLVLDVARHRASSSIVVVLLMVSDSGHNDVTVFARRATTLAGLVCVVLVDRNTLLQVLK